MPNTYPLLPAAGLRGLARFNLVGFVFAGARGAWDHSLQRARLRAEHLAIRQMDRRTRQDLGLDADGEQWGREGPLASDYERLRW
jgi:hypothetical protein